MTTPTACCAAGRLLAAGVSGAIVTLGAKGALLSETGQAVLIPAQLVNAVDTTAAGDAFNGALAWALGSGMTLEQAVRQACLAGALAATRLGAQPSLPTKAELSRFTGQLRSHKQVRSFMSTTTE